jgi:hypothetical protein
MRGFPALALFIERPTGGSSQSGMTIVSALQAATLPSREHMAGYVVRRTGRVDLGDILPACFGGNPERRGDDDAPSRSTLNRRLSSFGPLTARDWRAVVSLVRTLHRPPCPGATIEQIAWAGGLDPRTLREHASHYLGVSARQAAEVPGWEWKVEAVLRRWDYVRETPATPAWMRRSSGEHQLA